MTPPCGRYRACGLREGLDLRTPDGRHAYYPVGRGGLTLYPNGMLAVRNVNAGGTFVRRGRWAMEGGLLLLRLGADTGRFRVSLEGARLRLTPCASWLPRRLLHAPEFERVED